MSLRSAVCFLSAVCAAVVASACGLEGELIGPLTDDDNVRLPEPAETVIHARATSMSGGSVTFYTGGGSRIADAEAPIEGGGVFSQGFQGTEAYRGLYLWASQGDRVVVGLLPEVPRQPTVFHDVRHVTVWEPGFGHPSLSDLNTATTAFAFVLSASARSLGVTLDALERDVIAGGLDDAVDLLAVDGSPLLEFAEMVVRLDAAAATAGAGLPVFRPEGLGGEGSLLSRDWLTSVIADYDADGIRDTRTDAFDAALAAAAADILLGICYPADRIRVVFQVDLRDGVINRNCTTVDAFKWTVDDADKQVFFAGGVHEDSPVCGDGRTTACLTAETIDEANATLGGWKPNIVPMYDDGAHGDETGGDDIWTVIFELPYWPIEASPDGAGVRLGYKYTFGVPGQGWTDAEEWPGNQRLLELVDLNGNHRISRYDIFGDEAANKDKVNALKISKDGCGTVQWEAERDPTCAGDSRENRVDEDGDCEPDGWASTGRATPLTEPCE